MLVFLTHGGGVLQCSRWSFCIPSPPCITCVMLVRRQIEFKIACLVHQSLSGRTPTYLTADIQLAVDCGRQNLCSATDRTCFLPQTHNTFGDRSFSVAGPRVWNSLPADLRLEMQFRAFRRQLKTVLFSRLRPRHIVTFCFFYRALINTLTYTEHCTPLQWHLGLVVANHHVAVEFQWSLTMLTWYSRMQIPVLTLPVMMRAVATWNCYLWCLSFIRFASIKCATLFYSITLVILSWLL